MVFENTFLPLILSGAGIPIPTSMIKLVRLLRLARMARLMRNLPELVAMVKGVRQAFRAVGSALLLLAILVYVFAIIMFMLIHDNLDAIEDVIGGSFVQPFFGTLTLTMWSMLVDGAFMDSFGLVSRKLIQSKQWLPLAVMLVFVLASSLTVMNMLIGVLCEVVTSVSIVEKEEFDIRLLKDTLLVMLLELDKDESGFISSLEIQLVLENARAMEVLEGVEVKPSKLVDHVQMFLEESDDGGIMIADVMDLILMLRGRRPPKMHDLLHCHEFLSFQVRSYILEQENLNMEWFTKIHDAITTRTTIMENKNYQPSSSLSK